MKTAQERLLGIRTLLLFAGWVLTSHLSLAAPGSGDANGDGKLDASDAQIILQKAVSAVSLGSGESASADVNGDGQVNALDAILVLQRVGSQVAGGVPGFSASARVIGSSAELQLVFEGAARQTNPVVEVRLLDLAGTT